MTSELKVYNRFGELTLHLRFVAGHALPLQIEDGTPELQKAVRNLFGQDFDETVVVDNQRQRFTAKWGTPEYLDALAGYWSRNFRWRTRTTSTTRSIEVLKGPVEERDFKVLAGSYPFVIQHTGLCTAPAQSSRIAGVCELAPLQAASYNLFFVPNKPRQIFEFQSLGQMPGSNYFLGYGVAHPTLQVSVKCQDPAQQPSIQEQLTSAP